MDDYMDIQDHIDRVDNDRTFINRFRLSKEAVLILLKEINSVDDYKKDVFSPQSTNSCEGYSPTLSVRPSVRVSVRLPVCLSVC